MQLLSTLGTLSSAPAARSVLPALLAFRAGKCSPWLKGGIKADAGIN